MNSLSRAICLVLVQCPVVDRPVLTLLKNGKSEQQRPFAASKNAVNVFFAHEV